MGKKIKEGTDKVDYLYGADGDDWYLYGYGGDDYLFGADGDDILVGGKGADYLQGGREKENGDTADYSSSDAAVIVNLHTEDHVGHGYGGEAEGDTLVDIENLGARTGNTTMGCSATTRPTGFLDMAATMC